MPNRSVTFVIKRGRARALEDEEGPFTNIQSLDIIDTASTILNVGAIRIYYEDIIEIKELNVE